MKTEFQHSEAAYQLQFDLVDAPKFNPPVVEIGL
jgi:hypothetical protein